LQPAWEQRNLKVMADARPVGALLVNLGTPDSPEVRDVRRYLREFLCDPRVIDLPAPLRLALVYGVILPLRPRRSAAQYASIWIPEGSPLRVYSEALRAAVERELGPEFRVALAMRYGQPSIDAALDALVAGDVERIVVVPLFPQYSSAATGSALERVLAALARRANVPAVSTVNAFYGHPAFVAALAEVTRTALAGFDAEHVLFSFHGLPERQIRASDPTGRHCLARAECCAAIGPENRDCYRAQSFATARALAAALALPADRWSVSFQSRLGRAAWIAPATDRMLPELAARGVRRLAVACPSFVADCLETLEEIGIRAREQWRELGGEELRLTPCVNAAPRFVAGVAQMVRDAAGARR
jgi:ferrochelatase